MLRESLDAIVAGKSALNTVGGSSAQPNDAVTVAVSKRLSSRTERKSRKRLVSDEGEHIGKELKKAIEEGDFLQIGKCIREAAASKSISEAQFEEIARISTRPKVSIFKLCSELDECDFDKLKSYLLAQQFMSSIPIIEAPHLRHPEVTSITKKIQKESQNAIPLKRRLDSFHALPACHPFKAENLNEFYIRCNLIGDTSPLQLSSILAKLLKTVVNPTFHIWLYSFRPSCVRSADCHFRSLPNEVLRPLQDFSMDVLGGYLPDHLAQGNIDLSDPFVMNLQSEDPSEEIANRRLHRSQYWKIANDCISQTLRQIRTYHLNMDTFELEPCQLRNRCLVHLTWRQMRQYRQKCTESLTVEDISDPRAIYLQSFGSAEHIGHPDEHDDS